MALSQHSKTLKPFIGVSASDWSVSFRFSPRPASLLAVRQFSTTTQSNPQNHSVIDLRSDTVTAPSASMLQSVLTARTGDDVMGEDPTVHELQNYVADLFGKEAGLFVPTGTMSNLVALLSHCHGRASEVMIGGNSHLNLWEGGNLAGLGGIHTRQLMEDSDTAQFNIQDIHDACRAIDDDDHCAKTEVLCLENTHNMLGGVALPTQYMNDVGTLAHSLGIRLHVDGARIFNAAICHNVSVRELCASADSVSVCLSKGLGAPLGSVLVGETEFIRLAKRARKRCGGGMRQAGVVAAMGLHAIQENVDRLHQDHVHAQRLAVELARSDFHLPKHSIDTNILYFGLPNYCLISKNDFLQRLDQEYNVKLTGGYSRGGDLFRAVTHLDISSTDIERAAEAMTNLVQPADR